ncbi:MULTISPECIES: YdcH family protein [Shewanella]|uniref:YdcH family protein n=1 Tax=Shewanella fidelis TaxID=173509 RepID=A0AAW8NK20_9GAMM|nr:MULTISPECIES: YdcH family protein [Shewanella]MDR8522725.1 YdcH family protein [Shewanella fidelis]MDW4812340.1 YdcH family protein [Shewanella fidelis]MDW4815995.1 YdcH family protein [Shewanella fidelis]MDW4820581.1 YdcH family protein [Shewanella fidelis]MDW4824804.1 YdcH family protein [Shewanella fidelis]
MLGEDHSLIHEFPEYQDSIAKLCQNDEAFAKDTKHYNALDKEIRILELKGAPIDDEAMHKLKHDRAVLKDALYQQLVNLNGA